MVSLDTFFGEDSAVLQDVDFQLLLLATVMPPLGVSLLSPLIDSLTGPFAVSESAIALMVSVYTAPGIVLVPLAGLLADRYGRRPLLVWSLVIFGVTGAAVTLTTDFRVALGLRFLQGVGGAAIVPIIITSIGDRYGSTTEATAQGLRFSISGISQAVFPLMAGFIVVLGWQYPILLYALAVPVALLVHLYLDETSAETVDSVRGESQVRALVRLATSAHVFALLTGRALPSGLYFGFLAYNSLLVVRVLGGTAGQAGVLVAISSGVFALSSSQSGRVASLFDRQLTALAVMGVVVGAGIALAAVAPSISVAAAGVALFGSGFGLLITLYRSLITTVAPDHLRGGLVGLGETLGRVGVTAFPLGMGLAIGLLDPHTGGPAAIRLTLFGTAVLTTLAGLACVSVATFTTPPAAADSAV